jgi:hypothetical protein
MGWRILVFYPELEAPNSKHIMVARLFTKQMKDVMLELTLIVRNFMFMNNKAYAG